MNYEYLPSANKYTGTGCCPSDSTLATCAFCGDVFFIPKGDIVSVTCFCDGEECQAELKRRNLKKRRRRH